MSEKKWELLSSLVFSRRNSGWQKISHWGAGAQNYNTPAATYRYVQLSCCYVRQLREIKKWSSCHNYPHIRRPICYSYYSSSSREELILLKCDSSNHVVLKIAFCQLAKSVSSMKLFFASSLYHQLLGRPYCLLCSFYLLLLWLLFLQMSYGKCPRPGFYDHFCSMRGHISFLLLFLLFFTPSFFFQLYHSNNWLTDWPQIDGHT